MSRFLEVHAFTAKWAITWDMGRGPCLVGLIETPCPADRGEVDRKDPEWDRERREGGRMTPVFISERRPRSLFAQLRPGSLSLEHRYKRVPEKKHLFAFFCFSCSWFVCSLMSIIVFFSEFTLESSKMIKPNW